MQRWYIMYLLLWVFMVLTTRMGMSDAFRFKKNKRKLKVDRKLRPIWKKVLDIYSLTETNAPHHMKKYIRMRICNLILLFPTSVSYFLIPHLSKWVFLALFVLHTALLVVPMLVDIILTSGPKDCGKRFDFSQSKQP